MQGRMDISEHPSVLEQRTPGCRLGGRHGHRECAVLWSRSPSGKSGFVLDAPIGSKTKAETTNALCPRNSGNALIQALEAPRLALQLLLMAFDGCRSLTFARGGGLFVGFTSPGFGKYASFLAGAFEASQGDIKGFVFSYLDGRHKGI